jgi:IS5 family transposase
MEVETIIAYVICDDTIKELHTKEDTQTTVSMAEVMTTAIIAALIFSGNLEKARKALKSDRYIPNMLSKSQLSRRLHSIPKDLWHIILERLFQELEKNNVATEFVVDSCPMPTCKLARYGRSKLYANKKYIGYCAAKNEFFVGMKLHLISDTKGNPKQFKLLPASESDITGLRKIDLRLPKNSSLYGDKAYNDYGYEDQLVQEKQVHLRPIRKRNSKRRGIELFAKLRQKKRKIIETTFSCIEKLMPRSIHAVTLAGFELKVMCFVLAYAVSNLTF